MGVFVVQRPTCPAFLEVLCGSYKVEGEVGYKLADEVYEGSPAGLLWIYFDLPTVIYIQTKALSRPANTSLSFKGDIAIFLRSCTSNSGGRDGAGVLPSILASCISTIPF